MRDVVEIAIICNWLFSCTTNEITCEILFNERAITPIKKNYPKKKNSNFADS
jgi:hypothetical protein